MCIIIYKPEGCPLSLSTVLRAYQYNDDGWGMIARAPQGLIVRRDFGRNADETLLDAYDELRQYDLTIHCRIGTSGKLDIRNTHPFNVIDDLWLFHNGTMNVDMSADREMCDSFFVARQLAEALQHDFAPALADPLYVESLKRYAGTSKLVLVHPGAVVIVNEELGYWQDGCWYSNDSAEKDGGCRAFLTATTQIHRGSADDAGAFDVADGFDDDYYYPAITPRDERVKTQADEDELFRAVLFLQSELEELGVDDLADHCLSEPEMTAELLYSLLQSHRMTRRVSQTLDT